MFWEYDEEGNIIIPEYLTRKPVKKDIPKYPKWSKGRP